MIIKVDRSNHVLTRFFNPFWRALAGHLSEKCEKCGQEKLLSVFDKYSGNRRFQCESCAITSIVLTPLIHSLFFSLNVDNRTVKQLLKDQLIRRCMLDVVKGIADFGLRYPRPPAPQ